MRRYLMYGLFCLNAGLAGTVVVLHMPQNGYASVNEPDEKRNCCAQETGGSYFCCADCYCIFGETCTSSSDCKKS